MISELKEQQQRFEEIMSALPNYPCSKCPVHKECAEYMAQVKTEKELDECPTCEEILLYWVMHNKFLEKKEENAK